MRQGGGQKKAACAECAHGDACKEGADDGPYAKDHQETARDLNKVAIRVVVRVGNDDGIHRKDRSTENSHQGKIDGPAFRGKCHECGICQKANKRHPHQHFPAVHTVRQDADRYLCRRPGQDRKRRKKRDAGNRKSDPIGINGRKCAEGAVRHADHEDGQNRDGRGLPDLPDVDLDRDQRFRAGRRGYGCWDKSQHVSHRADDKEEVAARIAQGQGHLPGGRSD